MIGIAADDRMILKRAKTLRERHMFAARDVLIAQKKDLVFQQKSLDLGEELRVAGRIAEIDVLQLCTQRAGQRFDNDRASGRDCSECRRDNGGHGFSLPLMQSSKNKD